MDEIERLEKLRSAGVTSVTFHAPTGSERMGAIASVSFEPSFPAPADPTEEEQRDPSTPVKRERRSTGGLVPRERSSA